MMANWHSRSQQERKLILLGAVSVVLILLIVLVLMPFWQTHQKESRLQTRYEQELIWMTEAVDHIKELRKNGTLPGHFPAGQNIRKIVSQSAKKADITGLSSIADQGDNSAKLTGISMPFGLLMNWLEMLWTQYGITAVSVKLTPAKTSGRVDGALILKPLDVL
ncbi:MAG: type II secretion system protein M [Magnetococcales bacterium]|nr:type II secretion system protein M [Magnetococcales bacterium]